MIGVGTPFGTPFVVDASLKQIFGVCIGLALFSFGLIIAFGMECASCFVFGLVLTSIGFMTLLVTFVYAMWKICRQQQPEIVYLPRPNEFERMSVDDIVVDI